MDRGWTEPDDLPPPRNTESAAQNALASINSSEPQTSAPALDWAALTEDPPARRWAESGWFGHGHATLLAGEGGIGKTLLAQQWASCLATSRRLFHQDSEPLRVLMWACEDDHDELWRRQAAICGWQGTRLDDYTNFRLVPRVGLPNMLLYSEYGRPQPTALMQTLAAEADAFQADVVILDNIAQLYAGGENDRPTVTYFVNALVGILKSRAIMLLGHPAKAAGSEFSGSTAWEASVRSRLYFGHKLPGAARSEDDTESDNRVLARRKANYASKDFRKFTYRDGVFIPDSVETFLDSKIRGEAQEQGIIQAFKGCRAANVIVVAATRGMRTAYHVLAERPEFPDSLRGGDKPVMREFWNILERLRQRGIITEAEHRRPDRHWTIQFVLK